MSFCQRSDVLNTPPFRAATDAAGDVSDTPPVGLQPLKAHALTGNGEMAEDLDRVACSTCSRLFAPSVLARHAPICAARAAKDAAKGPKAAPAADQTPASSAPEISRFLEEAGLLRVHGLLEAIVGVAADLQALSMLDRERLDAAIAPVQLKPKSQKYKNLMAAHESLQRPA